MGENIGLPKKREVEELAGFFDCNDTQNLEWGDADVEFKRPELVHISVRLHKEDLMALKRGAEKKGIGYTTYLRMLLREAIRGAQ